MNPRQSSFIRPLSTLLRETPHIESWGGVLRRIRGCGRKEPVAESQDTLGLACYGNCCEGKWHIIL